MILDTQPVMENRSMRPVPGADRTALRRKRRKAIRLMMVRYSIRTLADWVRMAGLPSAAFFYKYMNGGSENLSQDSMDRLVGCLPGATHAEFLGDMSASLSNLQVLPVHATATIGRFRDFFEVKRAVDLHIPIPRIDGIDVDEVVELIDDHAEPTYRTGAFLGIETLQSLLLRRPLRVDDRVLVVATRERNKQRNRIEVTVREVRAGPKGLVLAYCNPAYTDQQPLPVNYAGGPLVGGPYPLYIRGRVAIASILENPNG